MKLNLSTIVTTGLLIGSLSFAVSDEIPKAAPTARPEELLAAAIDAMESAGVWRVDWHANEQTKTGQKDGRDIWGGNKRIQQITGLVSGKDFDLTSTTTSKNELWRMVGIKETVWQCSSNYKKWAVAVKQPPMGNWPRGSVPPDSRRSYYDDVQEAFKKLFISQSYEVAGTETHDGNTWLHIRMTGAEDNVRGRPEYWIELDQAGHAVAVRHCTIVTADGGTDRHFRVNEERQYEEWDFTPAKVGEKIEQPPGNDQRPISKG